METTIRLYEYVMAQLGKTELVYQEVAEGSGESKRTVEKIARKEILDPGVSHCENVAAFFRELATMPGESQREQFRALMARRQQQGGVVEHRRGLSQ